MYYLDPKIENLYRIFDQNERKDYLRLDLNENPGGLPQEFIDGLSVVCEDFAYGCKTFPTFGIEDKKIVSTIKNILEKYVPF